LSIHFMASAKLVTARDFSPRLMERAFAHEPGDHLRGAANLQVIAGQQEVLVDAPDAQVAVSHAHHGKHPALVLFIEARPRCGLRPIAWRQYALALSRVAASRWRYRSRYRGQAGRAGLRRR
jgi:hypothetical protein